MRGRFTNRGFVAVYHPRYVPPHDSPRLIQESSAVGDYDDAFDNPGSSFLWVGEYHHLSREEVVELIGRMQAWLDTKRLGVDEDSRSTETQKGADNDHG